MKTEISPTEQLNVIHAEMIGFLDLLERIPNGSYRQLFAELVKHTQEHFAVEQAMMAEFDFPARAEHLAEHQRMLAQLAGLDDALPNTDPHELREFVDHEFADWIEQHIAAMDQPLQAHIERLH